MTQVILGDKNHFSTHEQGSAPGLQRGFFRLGDFQPSPAIPLKYIFEKNSGLAGILKPGTQSGARPGARNFQNLSPDGARILLPG